jgi:hypothetical protein
MIYNLINWNRSKLLPKASEVLDVYLRQENCPFWTAYFVKQKDVVNDQFTQACFIHKVDEKNEYLILRTACFPFVKYHCSRITRREYDPGQIKLQNKFYNIIKIMNLGMFVQV